MYIKPTRLEKTEQSYRKRTFNLVAQCRKKLCIPQTEELDYRRFVGWLITQKPQWSRDTWRQYKSSVVFFLEKEADNNMIASEALDLLEPTDVTGCIKKSTKTSSSKQKKVPLKEYKILIKHIQDFGSPWADDVVRWISSSLLTGLRPIEWAQSQITVVSNLPALVVYNAKATNGRAHGITRTIFLDGLTQEEITMISEHVQRAHEWEQAQQYERFYHGCASTLARAIKHVWPKRTKHITLYSMRHQFSANAKASGFTREEIAALMGHAVDTTATEHYGKKTAGYDMIRVRPDPAEVARVRSIFKGRTQPKPIYQQNLHQNTVLKPKHLDENGS